MFILLPVRRGDVMAAWSGIRPLVCDPNKSSTQSIARNHIIEVADNKLITIAGEAWIGSQFCVQCSLGEVLFDSTLPCF